MTSAGEPVRFKPRSIVKGDARTCRPSSKSARDGSSSIRPALRGEALSEVKMARMGGSAACLSLLGAFFALAISGGSFRRHSKLTSELV